MFTKVDGTILSFPMVQSNLLITKVYAFFVELWQVCFLAWFTPP